MRITNNLNLPKPFVDAVSKDYEYQPKRYSVTSIQKGIREILLTRRHHNEIEQDVADMIWMILGSSVHYILENTKEEFDELKETKITVELPNGYTLSGQQDLYSESKKRITDYKTGTVWKVLFDEWDDYREQTLMYAWMFKKHGFPVDNADIVMILKDWSKTKAETEQNYPPHPVYIKHFDFTEKDFADIENKIITKFMEIEAMEDVPDEALPLCTEEERWTEPTKYAVKKVGNKRADKLCDTLAEANDYMINNGKVKGYEVEERKGTDKKCTGYCSCKVFCPYWREKYGNE